MRITSELAHPIILKLKALVNHNINIMNDEGVIVASTDSNRLYQIHEGALKVFETKKPILIYQNDENMFHFSKPGVNLPVVIHNKIIGVIGITGNPDDVIKFAQILKVTVEVMLQEIELSNKLQYETKIMERWVIELIHPHETDSSKLEIDAKYYLNLDINKEISIFLIRFDDLTVDDKNDLDQMINIRNKKEGRIEQIRSFIPKISFSAFLDDGCCLVALSHMKDNYLSVSRSIKSFYASHKLGVHIGIGNSYHGINGYRKSYLEACESLMLLDRFPKDEKIAHISEWGFVTLFQQVSTERLSNFYSKYLPEKIKLNDEQIHTLQVLFNSDLNMKLTAQRLHIHRNTLLYRLDNIAKQTDLDPKSFQDAMMLRLLMVIEKLTS